jgi:hypothetical protein
MPCAKAHSPAKISNAAGAFFRQVSKGYYWKIVERQKEIIASYFPTSRAVIRELVGRAGIGASAVRWILPTGVSKSSWDILANIAGSKQHLSGSGELRPHHRSGQSSAFGILTRIKQSSFGRPVAPFHLWIRLHLVRSHSGESMSEHVFLTGATGAIGVPLAAFSLAAEPRTAHCYRSLLERSRNVARDSKEPQSRSGYY